MKLFPTNEIKLYEDINTPGNTQKKCSSLFLSSFECNYAFTLKIAGNYVTIYSYLSILVGTRKIIATKFR